MHTLTWNLHLFTTFTMTGIIWFIQVVHYPRFHRANESPQHFRRNAGRTGFVVIPLMLVELATAFLLVYPFWNSFSLPSAYALANLAGIALTWLATALFSVPCHHRLGKQEYDAVTVTRLIRTNWIRTFLWSARSALLLSFTLNP